MLKFKRHKTYAEIKAQCEAQGVPLNDHLYLTDHWDTVVVNSTYRKGHCSGYAVYNVFNGRFFGYTPSGVGFVSGSNACRHEPWFQDLLKFFYVEA